MRNCKLKAEFKCYFKGLLFTRKILLREDVIVETLPVAKGIWLTRFRFKYECFLIIRSNSLPIAAANRAARVGACGSVIVKAVDTRHNALGPLHTTGGSKEILCKSKIITGLSMIY